MIFLMMNSNMSKFPVRCMSPKEYIPIIGRLDIQQETWERPQSKLVHTLPKPQKYSEAIVF